MISNFTDRFLFQFLAFCCLMATPAVFMNAHFPDPEPNAYQKHKAEVASAIYQKLERTVKDSRKAPVFNFIFNKKDAPYYNAYFDPQNNTINLGEGIYDLAVSFGKDSLNALAMVIGHELAHFYKDHGWGMSFGLANEDTKIAKKIYDLELTEDLRSRMEAEADYFGGLYGYMAGYNTLKVGGAFYNKLYKTVGLPDSTFGYPTRADRVMICNNSVEMLRKLLPVFKTANLLTLTQQYKEAGWCYDYVINVFPSRELYNNAGVAYLFAAIETYEQKELPYLFPLGLDMDSRLELVNKKGTAAERQKAERLKLLKQSKAHFEDAIRIEEDYLPAYLNLSIVLCLLQEYELSTAYASKTIRMAKEQEEALMLANAHIVKGIVNAMQGEKSAARKEFQQAKKDNELLASANLEALKNNKIAKLFRRKQKKEIEGPEESIAELGVEVLELIFDDRNKLDISYLQKQNDNRPETIVVAAREPDFEAILMASYGGPMGLKESLQGFLMTKPDYEGASARDIRIGATFKEVIDAYGQPQQSLSGLQEHFHVYPKTKIIFITDPEEKVQGWILYGKVR